MTNPTTPFSWQMPTSTDLVTDLPADFEVFGQAVATSMADLLGGTTGQILSKASNTNMDFTWITNDVGDITAVTAGTGISGGGTSGAVTITNSMATEITASGDMIVGTGSGTFDNLPIGTTGQVLTADTTVSPYKIKWATPASSTPSFVGCFLTKSVAQSTANGTLTAITFDVEELDTDAFHSTSTNTSRITIPTGKDGKYLIIGQVTFAGNTTGARYFKIIKNGSGDGHDIEIPTSSVSNANGFAQQDILSLVAGDYLEIAAGQASGGSLNVLGDNSGPAKTRFAVTYLGA
jgi:hypothetical protein